MGRVAVREPLIARIGFPGSDFTNNVVRYFAERRSNLAVERPSAILALSGLPPPQDEAAMRLSSRFATKINKLSRHAHVLSM
jgi:hypothetical protein